MRRVISAREQVEMLSPWRMAALDDVNIDKLTGRLADEFHEWHSQQQAPPENPAWHQGLGYWGNIESFLKDRYPATHRGFSWGREQAQQLLNNPDFDPRASVKPYEVDEDTRQKLGYDPEEIAAGMLLLHNNNNNSNWRIENPADRRRLLHIFDQRMKMQRAYEQRQLA